MLMANDNSNSLIINDSPFGEGGVAGEDDFSIDLDSFLRFLGETPDSTENRRTDSWENVNGKSASQFGANDNSSPQGGFPDPKISSSPDCSFDAASNSSVFGLAKMAPLTMVGSPARSGSSRLTEGVPSVRDHSGYCSDTNGVLGNSSSYSQGGFQEYKLNVSYCSTPFTSAAADGNHVSRTGGSFDSNDLIGEPQFRTTHLGGSDSNCFSRNGWLDESFMNHEPYVSPGVHSFQTSGAQDIGGTYMMNGPISSYSASHSNSHLLEITNLLCESGDQSAAIQCYMDTDDYFRPIGQYFPDKFLQSVGINDETLVNIKGEGVEIPTQNTGSTLTPPGEAANGFNIRSNGRFHVLPSKSRFNGPDSRFNTLLKRSSRKQGVCIKNEDNDEPFPTKGTNRTLTSISSRTQDDKDVVFAESKRPRSSVRNVGETTVNPLLRGLKLPFFQPEMMTKQLDCLKEELKGILPDVKMAETIIISHQPVKSRVTRYDVDDDSDICILENLSKPARSSLSAIGEKAIVTVQTNSYSGFLNHGVTGGVKLKTNDERHIFQVALQDLSQPKSECAPPEGLLAVPLLRHQRIALAWMVQMETASVICSGGILADDQGLGKTVSTIALILKERSPSPKISAVGVRPDVTETLNLDVDDESVPELDGSIQDSESCNIRANGDSVKGRPAAGTLVVCPTSVLRQWNEELHNKVTNQANLSVLVYHGGNRTKDPLELTKYDVVVTTYSIVSMEVPKQPLVDEDKEETGKRHYHPQVSRKRKYPPATNKRIKGKKGADKEFFEAEARPLARVGWFRVVLDEAQSIKNHKTQVARACWGLRAKRRWCLSGTPMQNAVDDLYSYFRFLRYDPYAIYTKFCSTIKAPIQRNPTSGYKKLQAVLKTIMLRRTKGTFLDGEPIIDLPPKTIELKKVDFTLEERDFYCQLEADSRAQFAEYAAAGTVKQNYVNILLMLLRLRQACDHPLLVRGCEYGAAWRSSVDMAKKLPHQKQISLLNCLEASLALCGICSDPPEDAVVTSCEHVFCNQCISEHLNGDEDDKQCPITNCNAHLSKSQSVFSRTALKSSLSDRPGQSSQESVKLDSSSSSEHTESVEPCMSNSSFNSSKIKAALEVLKSLSKPQLVCQSENSSGVKDPKDSVLVAGEKAIVFSQWTGMLDLLEACLKSSSIQYRRLDGTMTVVARDKAVKDFNTLPEVSVMIMSLKAASLGLNMVAACHVLLLDLWWNPTTEDQAIDRAHRIGQTRPVTVLRLTVKDTVEDRILALQQKKREMVSSAFGEDESGSHQTRLTVEDLNYLFMA